MLKFITSFIFIFLNQLYAKNQIDFLVVYKENRNIVLHYKGKVIETYDISLGFEPLGSKIKRGDGKTPEGLYYIEEKISNSAFFLALKISYPNPWDIRRALELDYHPGGQIMIHGMPNEGYDINFHNLNNDWTEGCIAITNPQMKSLWKKINIGTPILIMK
ncbi:MAG: hypothetical protein CMP36_00840 [Rickettsiales bacterium]|nr:hypothetical protein [Rickettsiales bacterium]OUV82957.1 MAG: hypothetical protein CBC91_01220 [Rickettsiales bacterium TMED131]|tara:strand:+ start:2359 stop:2841 length:483 start_codon:yes stop_codon:yes gene_type:complete